MQLTLTVTHDMYYIGVRQDQGHVLAWLIQLLKSSLRIDSRLDLFAGKDGRGRDEFLSNCSFLLCAKIQHSMLPFNIIVIIIIITNINLTGLYFDQMKNIFQVIVFAYFSIK